VDLLCIDERETMCKMLYVVVVVVVVVFFLIVC